MRKSCARPRQAVFRRVMPRNDISSCAELDQREALWWFQNWKNEFAAQLAEEAAIRKE